jgi:hypothetical protein
MLSREWREWHLTPDGWKPGSVKTDFADSTHMTPDPPGSVAVYRVHEDVSSMYSAADRWVEEVRVTSPQEAQLLIQKFGECPKRL